MVGWFDAPPRLSTDTNTREISGSEGSVLNWRKENIDDDYTFWVFRKDLI